MTRLRRREDGYALVTAMVLLGVMLMVGLTVVSLGDTQAKRSGEQRIGESSLNLAEGVLYGQGFVLAQNWPNAATTAYPSQCTEAAPAGDQCPNRDTLAAANSSTKLAAVFDANDFAANTQWVTKVRDDVGALASDYDVAAAGAAPAWDSNGNKKMWVQARTVVRGRPRNVVAKLQLEKLAESTPQAALTAGAISTTNSGNSQLINDTGGGVFVRCSPNNNNPSNNTCAGFDLGQILPVLPTQIPAATDKPMMDASQLARFKQRAITDKKYFPGCPPSDADLSGAVVWVEGCLTEPSFSNALVTTPCDPPEPAPVGMSGSCINNIAKPGLLLWHCGRSDWQGGMTYVGVIYMVNNSDGTCVGVPQLGSNGSPKCTGRQEKKGDDGFFSSGGFGIWGALSIDGPACAKIGSNGLQFTYDARVFQDITSYGTVGLIQNTWRELPAGT
jgi:Tfp pilus assembly protein PilX